MNKKLLCLIPILLLLSTVSVVSGATLKHSFLYTNFNSQTQTWKVLDATLSSWEVAFDVHLTWNTSSAKAVCWLYQTATGDDQYIQVCFMDDGTEGVWIWKGKENAVELGGSVKAWESGKYVKLSLYNGYFNVKSSNGTKIIDDFVLGTFKLEKVGASGDTDAFKSGYVSVLAGKTVDISSSVTEPILSMLPTVITIAVIGALFGLILGVTKHMGKW